MFRNSLMATTALVAGVAASFAAHERGVPSSRIHPRYVPEHVTATVPIGRTANKGVVHNNTLHWIPGAIFNNFSKDKNAEFVSWYGQTAVNSVYSHYFSSHNYYKFSEVGFNAIPLTGNGNAPKTMTFAGFGYASTYRFEGVILSATASGLPGNAIATTSSTALSDTSTCCTAARTVKFGGAPVLSKGKEYFAGVECANDPCYGGWNMEDVDFTGATVDYWHIRELESGLTGSGRWTYYRYSSPWHESTGYPTAGAVIIK